MPEELKSTKVEMAYRLLGFRIELTREKQDMTQDDLASKVGLDRSSISNIERGNQRILLHDVGVFAKALNVKPSELLKHVWEE